MKVILKRVLSPLKWLLIVCLKVLASLGFGYLIYSLLAPIAYAERGYMAYGGKCLLAIAATVLMLYFFCHEKTALSQKQKRALNSSLYYMRMAINNGINEEENVSSNDIICDMILHGVHNGEL